MTATYLVSCSLMSASGEVPTIRLPIILVHLCFGVVEFLCRIGQSTSSLVKLNPPAPTTWHHAERPILQFIQYEHSPVPGAHYSTCCCVSKATLAPAWAGAGELKKLSARKSDHSRFRGSLYSCFPRFNSSQISFNDEGDTKKGTC